MGSPVNPLYPLFLRNLNKCDCKPDSGGSSVVGGYPIVTIEDNFNIEAKPNIFYDIKNLINQEITIQCNPLELAPTRIYFTYDTNNGEMDNLGIMITSTIGLNIFKDDTKAGYNYKAKVDMIAASQGYLGFIEIYFTNNIIQGGNTIALVNLNDSEIELHINNINIIKTENIVNEFIFNFNCPCSIIYGNAFTWNKNDIPDLTQQGICTISIVNGVGCYTFVKT